MSNPLNDVKYEDKWMRVGDLEIDRRVQRVQANQLQVEKLVKEWDYALADLAYVSHRKNGSNVVLDGDHRSLAVRAKFGDEGKLYCRVFEDLTTAQEGYIFVGLNPGNQPSVIDKYRVGVYAGEEQATRIDRIVHSRGWTVDGTGGNGHIMAVRALRELDDVSLKMELEPHLIDYTLLVIGKAWGNDRYGVQSALLVGLGRFLAEYGDKVDLNVLIPVMMGYKRGAFGLLSDAQTLMNMRGSKKSMAVADQLVVKYNEAVKSERKKLRNWPYKR